MRKPDMNVTTTLLRRRWKRVNVWTTCAKKKEWIENLRKWMGSKKEVVLLGGHPQAQGTVHSPADLCHIGTADVLRRDRTLTVCNDQQTSTVPVGDCLRPSSPPGTAPVARWGCRSRSRFQTSADSWRAGPQSEMRLHVKRMKGRAFTFIWIPPPPPCYYPTASDENLQKFWNKKKSSNSGFIFFFFFCGFTAGMGEKKKYVYICIYKHQLENNHRRELRLKCLNIIHHQCCWIQHAVRLTRNILFGSWPNTRQLSVHLISHLCCRSKIWGLVQPADVCPVQGKTQWNTEKQNMTLITQTHTIKK